MFLILNVRFIIYLFFAMIKMIFFQCIFDIFNEFTRFDSNIYKKIAADL